MGLDGSRRFQSSYETQCKVFAAVVSQCASVGGRVLSIHSRQAVRDVLSILSAHSGFGTAVLQIKQSICWPKLGACQRMKSSTASNSIRDSY
ncbi:TatD family hydrolase [Aeromonas bestiarum]|uniref:TatD family hydrolase n=1 Tax=Aeromonas bestiarum TaxID=105751 RepID=UPI00338ECD07